MGKDESKTESRRKQLIKYHRPECFSVNVALSVGFILIRTYKGAHQSDMRHFIQSLNVRLCLLLFFQRFKK